jgi:hypothetical protein
MNNIWYNKCCYCIVNIYTRLTQLERINSKVKLRRYEFPKVLCIQYKINQEINFNRVFMSNQ